MENKNTATIEQYEATVGTIYKALKDLKDLMATQEYKEALKWDQEENDCDNNLHGEFSCFVQDLTETVYLWEKE